MLEAAKTGNFPVVKFLQENGANVNVTTRDDTNSPLLHASRNGFYTMAKFLQEKGANVNARNSFRTTPLIAASLNGHRDIVKLLQVNLKDLSRVKPRF